MLVAQCGLRSTGHVPFRRRCATLLWTLHARRRYSQTSDTTVPIRGTVLLDCPSIVIVLGVAVCPTLRQRTRHSSSDIARHLQRNDGSLFLDVVLATWCRHASISSKGSTSTRKWWEVTTESTPCDASRACRGKSSKNGCRNRTPIPHTNRRELVSRDDVSSWEVGISSGRPISSTCRI